MSRKRKAENVAQYLSQDGCEGLRRFVSHATLNLDLSGCDELARERLISAVKGRNTAEITLALKACSKIVDGLGRAGAQTIGAAARNIELVFSSSSSDPDVIGAGYEFIETTLSVKSPPEVDWEIVSSVNAKAPRQFGTLISTLLGLGDGWLCNNGRLVGLLLSAYFEQITILPSQLQTQILDAYRPIHEKLMSQIGGKIFTANVLRILAGIFRRTSDEKLKLWTSDILESITRNMNEGGIANYIDITQSKTNIQELLHNYKLLPMIKDALDFESEESMELVAKMLANREELWPKFFTMKDTRHTRKLLKMSLEKKVEVKRKFRDTQSYRIVKTILNNTLPGVNREQLDEVLSGKCRFQMEIVDLLELYQSAIKVVYNQLKRAPEGTNIDQAISVLLPRSNQIQNLLSRVHQKILQSTKDQEKEIARLIMRSALDYFKTLLEYQGATAIANVNLDKFIPKCKVDTVSLKKLLNLLHAKIDTTLWFRGKPAPIDHLLEMARDAENNEIKWEATRVITKIIDTPAWPILAASNSTDHIRSVAQILTSKSSQSKWLDKLESVLSGETENEKLSQSNFVIFDILLDQKAESQNYLPSLVLWLASKNQLKSETIVDEMITLGGDKFASLMSFSSGTKPSTTLDPIAQIIWWSEHLSKMKKVTQSMLEDVIERIEEVLEQNGELVKVFYGDYIHHHFVSIMTSSVEYDDVIKTELISFAHEVDAKLGAEIEQSMRTEFVRLVESDKVTIDVIRKNSPSCVEVIHWALRNNCERVNIICDFGSTADKLKEENGQILISYLMANLKVNDSLDLLIELATEMPDLIRSSTNEYKLAELLQFGGVEISEPLIQFVQKIANIFDMNKLALMITETPILLILLEHVDQNVDIELVTKFIRTGYSPLVSKSIEKYVTSIDLEESQIAELLSLKTDSTVQIALLEKLSKTAPEFETQFKTLCEDNHLSSRLIKLDAKLFFSIRDEIETDSKLAVLQYGPADQIDKVLETIDLPVLLENYETKNAELISWCIFYLVEKKSTLLTIDIVKQILACYKGTLSNEDQFLFDAFRRLANAIKEVKTLRPFLFGTYERHEKEVEEKMEEDDNDDESEISGPRAKMANLNRNESRALLAGLESEKLAASIRSIPIDRNYGLSEKPSIQSGLDQTIYDPSFLLPVLVDALRPSASIDVIQLVRTGVMSYVISCLTLKNDKLREGAIKCLTLIGEHGESFRWKSGSLMKQFLLILRKYIGKNEKPLNGIVAAYFVRSSKLLVNSGHLFYQQSMAGLVHLDQPVYSIPDFIEHFWPVRDHRAHRLWLLEIICDGIRTHDDLNILDHFYALDNIMAALVANNDRNFYLRTLEVVEQICQIRPSMVLERGIMNVIKERKAFWNVTEVRQMEKKIVKTIEHFYRGRQMPLDLTV